MRWVDRRAQLRAWVSSLVTKPGVACCESARISNCPKPDTPTDFTSLNHSFFIPEHLTSAWKVSLTLGEIAGEWRAPHTGLRVSRNSPKFLGHGLAEFCAVFTIPCRMYQVRIRQRFFLKIMPPFNHHVGFSVGGSRHKWHFAPPTWPSTDFRSLTPPFLFQPICHLRGKFG